MHGEYYYDDNGLLNGHVIDNLGEYWYKNGEYHREDGPAKIFNNGTKVWCRNGKFHRIGGPAIQSFKYEAWLVDGFWHREDGPALINSAVLCIGSEGWYLNSIGYGALKPENWDSLVSQYRAMKLLNT